MTERAHAVSPSNSLSLSSFEHLHAHDNGA